MKWLIDPLKELKEYNEILNSIERNKTKINISGLSDSQKAHFAFGLASHAGLKGLFITYNEIQARRFYEDFMFLCEGSALLFPTKEILYYDIEAKNNDVIYNRVEILDKLLEGNYQFIVASIEAISHKLPSRNFFIENSLVLKINDNIGLEKLVLKLVDMGYERSDIVEGKGQFSVRGGIIDVFSINQDNPARIEFFGDEIDSIRVFDSMTQLSTKNIESLKILPAREILCPVNTVDETAAKILDDLKKYENYAANKLSERNDDFILRLRENIERDVERIKLSPHFSGIDRYINYLPNMNGHLLDYIGESAVIFLDEVLKMKQQMGNRIFEHEKICCELLEKAKILPTNVEIYYSFDDAAKTLNKIHNSNICFNTIISSSDEYSFNSNIALNYDIKAKSIPSYRGFINMLANDIDEWKKTNNRIVILSGTKTHGEKICDELDANNIESIYIDSEGNDIELVPGKVIITSGSLNSGFEYPSIRLVVVSDKEFLGYSDKIKKSAKTGAKKQHVDISMFMDLKPGDYIVHQVHGIGQYLGIEKMVIENIMRDYIKIKYRQGDLLYVPTSHLEMLQKYIGAEGRAPMLSKLGGSEWIKTKSKVKESLKRLAEELIKLYATRKSIKGFAFSEDTVWQRQFEELFPFEETEDQINCTEEIKKDMESEKPMDRLLCGDVGYGKTEVAMRAMFKALVDGKQVAVLVPTTILAEQHYNNFKERLKDFPFSVEVISRFRTKAEQSRILKDLKKGNIDVLIGTHRLLQKDIQFKDLGLLIIDEEQRFGVLHKERLKNIRPDVDVLTLTATPIPRTLHMSLIGVRDISVIEEPPEGRYPVQTYVMEYNDDIIRDAIIKEMARGGQVFYLFNRVRMIELKAMQIKELVPEARVSIAHGQMDEKMLEEIMVKFLNGEFDILLCTTIIESGLDMPNVNTIIVEDADKLGLAQLYQLRGRVGRANRQAYAYITYHKDKVLTEIAEKRLKAIKEFTEFGSGFKIAMRDLELRGAGNLLGDEQHGHIESVGYEMYCRLLDESIKELKGEKVKGQKETEVTIELRINAYIDDEYINTESEKIEMYKKIASIENEDDMQDIRMELIDRFGKLPNAVENLLQIAYIKALLKNLGFASITQRDDLIILQVGSEKKINFESLPKLNAKYKGRILFDFGINPYLKFKLDGMHDASLLNNIKILLHDIKSFEVIQILDV